MRVLRMIALLMVLALTVLAGCSGGTSTGSTTAADDTAKRPETAKATLDSKEPIVLGGIVSLSGAVATLGKQDQIAMEVAAEQVNAAGGVLGRPLKLVFYDEFAEPAAILAQAEKDKVFAFVGFDNSSTALKFYPEIMKQKQILMISGAGSPALTDAVAKDPATNKYMFRNGNHARDWARTAAVYLRDIQKAKTYFYLAQDNPFGKSLEGIMAEQAKQDGITMVGSHYFERGSTNFDAALKAIADAKPDVIVGYLGPSGFAFAKVYNEKKLTLPLFDIAANSFELEDQVKTDLGDKANFLSLTLFAADVPITSKTKPFYKAYKEKSGGMVPGGLFDVRAGDAVAILAEAITQTGSLDSDKVVATLEKKTFNGAAGIYEFDSSHQAKWGPSHLSGLIGQWQNGKLEVIWPAQNQTGSYKAAPWWQAK